ncbi:hypothetical protein CC80DRAFT_394571, partial [Byssothecium circinans]
LIDSNSASDASRVYSWLLDSVSDDRGNRYIATYKSEDSAGVLNATSGKPSSLHEANRSPETRATNKHLKSIKYGNLTSTLSPLYQGDADQHWMFEIVLDYGEHHLTAPAPGDNGTWKLRRDPFSSYRSGFELRTYRLCQRILIFHHFPDEPEIGNDCLVKALEIKFRDQAPGEDASVGNPRGSLLAEVRFCGFRRPTLTSEYTKAYMAPISFTYAIHEMGTEMSTVIWMGNDIQSIPQDQMDDIPCPSDGSCHQFVDLYGEGIPGILINVSPSEWYYKEPLGNSQYAPAVRVPNMPSMASLWPSTEQLPPTQLLDIDGDGVAELVSLWPSNRGFSRLRAWEPSPAPQKPVTDDILMMSQNWEPFVPFDSFPEVNWLDSDVNWVDLTGDGAADLLVPGDMSLRWHPSLGTKGLGPPEYGSFYAKADQAGVRPIFSEKSNVLVIFADMTGDGLSDLVRIDNFGISYFPSLGYGAFGDEVAMDKPPTFDFENAWDPRRIRLADVDGTGPSDLIYLSQGGAMVYMNQCGNSWAEGVRLPPFPSDGVASKDWSDVQVVDLLGTGTGCLLWTSSIGVAGRKGGRFIDLSRGAKPNLLVSLTNNLGATTTIQYAASTAFSLEDKASGHRWRTLLPFPVQVVKRASTVDRVSQTYAASTFSYHHGFYDANGFSDREVRGFARVDRRDTETFDSLNQAAGKHGANAGIDRSTHIPPVLARTWYHVGAWLGSRGGVYSNYLSSEYFAGTHMLPEAPLPDSFLVENRPSVPFNPSPEDHRQFSRCLKGAVLRQEVYAEDGDPLKQDRPYSITENSYSVAAYQPGTNQNAHTWAVVTPSLRESVNVKLERESNMSASQIMHQVVLESDYFGNERTTVTVTYGRRGLITDELSLLTEEDRTEMKTTYATLQQADFTNALPLPANSITTDIRRLPMSYESRAWQLFNVGTPAGENQLLFSIADISEMVDGSFARDEIPFADFTGSSQDKDHIYRRRVSQTRFLFRKDDLSGSLPLGTIESKGMPHEGYRKCFPSSEIETALVGSGKLSQSELEQILTDEGRYVKLDGDWWVPSGKVSLSTDAKLPPDELAFAKDHFFLPHRYINPFDKPGWSTAATVRYDDYIVLVLDKVDAVGNRTTAGERDLSVPNQPIKSIGLDYRVLGPRLIMDPNGNRSESRFDALGMAVGTAVMGKPGEAFGDILDNFEEDLPESTVLNFLENPTQTGLADTLLKGASSRSICDPLAFYRDPANPKPAVVAIITREMHARDQGTSSGKLHIVFSYSNGLSQAIQVKGLVDPGPVDDNSLIAETRWISSPWTVCNNKGLAVQSFEPFYTTTHHFEFNARVGVSSTAFYDPLGRTIGNMDADHSWDKLVIGLWYQESWDGNDTTGVTDPRDDADIGPYIKRLPEERAGDPSSLFWPTWHAQRANGSMGDEEKSAAEKAYAHRETPSRHYNNALGQSFLSVVENLRTGPAGPVSEFLKTRIAMDLEGNARNITDSLGRQIGVTTYDMLGRILTEWDMEKGRGWHLIDIEGKEMYSWNERGDRFSTTFDRIARPVTTSLLRSASSVPIVVHKFFYGEDEPQDKQAANNLRGQCVKQYDSAGVVEHEAFDFKGNLARMKRVMAKDYKNDLDWTNPSSNALGSTEYTATGKFDALNHQIETVLPDSTLLRQVFDRQGHVVQLFVTTPGAGTPTQYLYDIQHDAKGQRQSITYGDGTGAKTFYTYDKLTYRLRNLVTRRVASQFPGDDPIPPVEDWSGHQIQNLSYFYDPVGNVTSIRDDAQQSIFFNGVKVDPSQEFVYDSIYRLTEASGREHLSSTYDAFDANVTRLPHPNDGRAMGRYTERYAYDTAGNILRLQHIGGQTGGWTRNYNYSETVVDPPSHQIMNSNRLSSVSIGNSPVSHFGYDSHGNITSVPHLSAMQWDYNDKLKSTSSQRVQNGSNPETTYYVYDGNGTRIRKVTERYAAEGAVPTIKYQKIYLGTLEITEELSSTATDPDDPLTRTSHRSTLQIDDGANRLVSIELNEQSSVTMTRYQFPNHIGSSAIELDEGYRVISYEEFTPYGSTSYQ